MHKPNNNFRYKNDVRIDSTYATSLRESRNELSFIANTKDNLARFRCEATNIMSPTPKIADVVLTVQCKCFYEIQIHAKARYMVAHFLQL